MKQQAKDRKIVARDVRLDSRNRISLGAAVADLDHPSFNIYRDERGNIILEPQVSVPAAEAWLHRNARARDSLARGLEQLATPGKTKKIGSFAKYADDDET